ncbi:MAG TPA: hypothetical protein VGV38_15405 [Pyrinomonadaceae bacterium]|nr:hypothetical protein [Pyrinomonadaceae bacterium]
MHLRLPTRRDGTGRGAVLLVVCCLLATGWSLPTEGCRSPKGKNRMISEKQAVEIATKELEKHNLPAKEYDITVETYRADKEQWIVWFKQKGPLRVPGNDHAVLVHKTTGEAVFLPGE